MSVELKIDGEAVDEEGREQIAAEQAEYEDRRAEVDESKLHELEGKDKGEDKAHLAADSTGAFARLRHKNSFFVSDAKKAAAAENLPHRK